MSDLFKSGQREFHSGCLHVSFSSASDIKKRLQKMEDGGKVAIKRTVSDFSGRAPAWVSKGIRQHYGVDTAAIKEAEGKPKRGRTSIRVAGLNVDGATLEYKGRTLTPTHFNMSPKKRPDTRKKERIRVPGQAIATTGNAPVAMIAPPKLYTIKATIIKGQRTSVGRNVFLASGNGGAVLPFQKEKGKGHMPIEAIRTLSVPQMIDGRAHDTVEEIISENLEKRFQHNIERAMKI